MGGQFYWLDLKIKQLKMFIDIEARKLNWNLAQINRIVYEFPAGLRFSKNGYMLQIF